MRIWLASLAAGLVIFIGGILLVDQFPILLLEFLRNQNWVLGLLTAVIISGIVATRFWGFRQYRRIWVAYGVFLVLHFTLAVPAVGRMGLIMVGRMERIYFLILSFFEGAAIFFILSRVTKALPKMGK